MIAVLYIAHGRTGIEVTVEVIGADALHESINVAVDRALTGYIRNCIQVQQQPDAVSARQGHADIRRILPTGQSPLSRSYDGAVGVADTAEEVRALRQRGIRVAAVFMGENASVPDARTISSAFSGWISLPRPPESSFRRRYGNCPADFPAALMTHPFY